MTANATRGEVSLTLDGTDYVLRPSFDAICAFEAETGRGLVDLADAARDGALRASEVASIAAACIRAWGKSTGDQAVQSVNTKRIGELIIEAEGGMMIAVMRLAVLLLGAATGGYTASGEVKAAATSPKIPAAE
jgi:hypothetical protein